MWERVRGWLRQRGDDEPMLRGDPPPRGHGAPDVTGEGHSLVEDGHLPAGERVDAKGTLLEVHTRPCEDLSTLIAQWSDGTETVELIWLGRGSIAGIEAGRTMRVQGRIASHEGNKAIYNPSYQLLSDNAS